MLKGPGGPATGDEESRAYLQARLTVLFQLMFWCFVVLVLFLYGAYRTYPEIQPRLNRWVYLGFTGGLAILAVMWRGLLVRNKKLTFRQLHAMDAFYAIATNTVIAACAVLSYDKRQAAYTCLLYAAFAVLTRALIVPSTGTRTAVVTSLASVPMAIATVILAVIADWPGPKDVPPAGFIAGFIQIQFVVVLLSAAGSQIIYGLRRKFTRAQRLGQYKPIRKIGEGGMGAVYLAHHVLLRRPTAVKLLRPERLRPADLERFEREVLQMSQLTHPNTVAVYDFGRSPDGHFYYAMEYLGGGLNLEQLVARHGRQPAERARQIGLQICGALQEAHERDLVHRDIKPANIILCERGGVFDVAKVYDFGLVKELSTDVGASQQVILGTPGFIAPELFTSPSKISASADLYALGAVLFFLVTGKPVFAAATDVDLCRAHLKETPPRPSEVAGGEIPRALEDVILRCLAKTPAERPPSAAALADMLRAIGPLPDWDDVRAEAWWRALPPETGADASVENLAITVDLDHRAVFGSEAGRTAA